MVRMMTSICEEAGASFNFIPCQDPETKVREEFTPAHPSSSLKCTENFNTISSRTVRTMLSYQNILRKIAAPMGTSKYPFYRKHCPHLSLEIFNRPLTHQVLIQKQSYFVKEMYKVYRKVN